jgi:hypothetical protein
MDRVSEMVDLNNIAALMQSRLESVREAISRELCAYPTPIAGCDAHVNQLLEDRSEVVDALQRLTRMRAASLSAQSLLDLARSLRSLDAATLAQIEDELTASRVRAAQSC